MHIDRIALTLRVRLSASDVWQYLPASASQAGRELAEAVDRYCREHALGYYPAIEFFRDIPAIDQNLIDNAERLAWVVSKKVREQVQSRLRPVFSSVKFRSIQTESFTLPPVRPNQSSALERLVSHYTPDTVKLELLVSLLRKDQDERRDAMEGYARKMMHRWLSSVFDEIEITSSVVLDESSTD